MHIEQRISSVAPAKINLYLAVTGKRADGFHDLVSLVAPIDFGDELSASLSTNCTEDTLEIQGIVLPQTSENLILKAAKLFREVIDKPIYFSFRLNKKIPFGAGLGGGSSDAVTALELMQSLSGITLKAPILLKLCSKIGSDCSLFVHKKPVIISGRGEVITSVSSRVLEVFKTLYCLVFKPPFVIETSWAYQQLVQYQHYISNEQAWSVLNNWLEKPSLETMPLFNSFQIPICGKFIALKSLLQSLRDTYQLPASISGSGSACFILLKSKDQAPSLIRYLKSTLGEAVFYQLARFNF